MANYEVSAGFNNTGGLATVSPQPAEPEPIASAEINYYGDLHADFNGVDNSTLLWTNISNTQRTTLLTAFGVSDTVASAPITMNLKLNSGSFAHVNAIVNYPKKERRTPNGWSGFELDLTAIEAI